MTRKDYEALAEAIYESVSLVRESDPGEIFAAREATVVLVASEIATVLAADNPLFNRKRFMDFALTRREGEPMDRNDP